MDDEEEQQKLPDLVKALVHHLLSQNLPPNSPPLNPTSSHFQNSLRYAHRILSSHLTPSVTPDAAAIAESIKRRLATEGRSSEALSFADLYTKFVSKAADVDNKWALLHLFNIISQDRKTAVKSQLDASVFLPNLTISDNNVGPRRIENKGWSDGVVVLAKDPNNRRDIVILVLIRHSFNSIPITGNSLKKKKDDAPSEHRSFKAYLSTLTLDFLVIVVPMLLLFTVLADWSYIIASLFTILTLLYIAVKRPGGSSPVLEEPNSVRAYITSYRVIVMIITILCILAVDFRIFPRRYAKTETYGASLAVELWLVDKAVLPIENSADGSIHRNYDLLLQHKLNLVGEVQLRANHCLLGLPGVTMEELVSVVSHPQALAQCRTVLNDLGVDKVRDQDTAVAAKTVAINCVRHTGAIASSRAAEIYGLDILAEGIQDDDENVTRFLVLAREPRIPGTDRPHKDL
ncbi:hypothetical protein KIW84_050925 [Lathyrus oleraceus]|uniref:Prephenate dehydratase domain-containing protein n=1 Tax=Pisum sativum TaxID=3888 RepID=A0A9D4WKM5_PEA|nr:hypothetical protein KIW84_050925 [Pisum sativum]